MVEPGEVELVLMNPAIPCSPLLLFGLQFENVYSDVALFNLNEKQ